MDISFRRPSLNRGLKPEPKKRNEESKLLLPQLEVCVVRVGGRGLGGGGGVYCVAAAAARPAQQFNLRFVRNLRSARRQGAWPSAVQYSAVSMRGCE